jgi:hypothetical protein
MFAPA